MNYENAQVREVASMLKARFAELPDKSDILKAIELKALFDELKTLPPEQRANFGKEVNTLKSELAELVDESRVPSQEPRTPIDVTAPFDINVPTDKRPQLLPSELGGKHPLMRELETVVDIFYRMGFTASESREIDDDWHMFTSLNFPEDHPARDDYDTFMAVETDKNGKRFIAPAHTSTMQNRLLKKYKANLEEGRPIAVIVPDRVFRNEDLDARHEHTFYQIEGMYVDRGVHAGNLVATIKAWLSGYYGRDMQIKTQPFYFPFTEPSFEFAAECIFCDGKGCNICSQSGWIELGGCGMIHPNVLKMADIDPNEFTGFAWGFGIDRLVMLKYNIEDVRHFESANLNFLRQFA